MAMSAQALVIGGGIAGGAVAAHLARAGRSVVLIERKAGPHHKVCGEFVSGEAADYLRDLNIDLESLPAVRLSALRLYARREMVTARLPFPAFSVSRRALDEAVLCAAAAYGADVRRGHSVRSLRPCDRGWTAGLDDGSKVTAEDAFLATGKHDLRGWKRPPGRQNDLVGFKLHWRLTAAQAIALGTSVELFLFPGGYAGLELVENGAANLCLVVRQPQLARLDNRWDLLLAGLRSDFLVLHQRLANSEPCWDRPLAIASIPYGHVQGGGSGPWRLGDQAAVIPSFSGDGISIALHSARLAAKCYLAGQMGSEFQARLAAEVTSQVRRATLISRMLVRPEGQAIAMAAARMFPNIIGRVARSTRIPSRCLIRAQIEQESSARRVVTG